MTELTELEKEILSIVRQANHGIIAKDVDAKSELSPSHAETCNTLNALSKDKQFNLHRGADKLWRVGFVIEKGIPLPTKKLNPLGGIEFDKFNVGDSILFPCEKGKDANRISRMVSDKMRHFRNKTNSKIKFVTEYQIKEGGMRIWRAEDLA